MLHWLCYTEMSIISRPQPNRPGIRLRAGLRRCETLQATKQPIPRQLFKPMGMRWCKDGTYYHTKLSVWRTEADSRSLAREGGTREPGPRPLLVHFPFGKRHSWIKCTFSSESRRKVDEKTHFWTSVLTHLRESDLSPGILKFYPDFPTPLRLHNVITTSALFGHLLHKNPPLWLENSLV